MFRRSKETHNNEQMVPEGQMATAILRFADVVTEARSGPELEVAEFMERFPRWSIDVIIGDGEAYKFFRRSFGDTKLPEDALYKKFADENLYFDAELMNIFETSNVRGEVGGGAYFELRVPVAPFCRNDVARVAAAEDYLLQAEIIRSPMTSAL
ncbi:MAG: hypothetical protein U0520_03065 [Candidatus Saccharimonadales bacterium]